ncbi:relaxase/mobilization nuclease domain-containing protein [Vermiculatibacterium agrestimuris]|uniref:relaxase/mobilization nuclease domain-containing protein n=1 Tax=Vermiculatibacterium agrestimuris TaxID=2941519 RepID=UPI0020404226|nr:relaxase/mobilization nuclease domain-containing protein [Vermiculatibacterium agrestimuris]
MATFTAIKNKAQSGSSLHRVLAYAAQEKKTAWKDHRLVTGHNCVAQSAYDEMMTTKRRFQKSDGRMFYQFVQSFSPAEDVTPEEVHTIGLELAQRLFPEFEVVVATHVDADHLHNHLIVNSVSWKDGRKLHQNAADLQRQRQISDQICRTHGLQVLESPKRHVQDKKMRPGEYRSAVRGESWKFQLMNTIDLCMRRAKRREDFIREMEQRGYQVRWEPTRQAITYTTPKGKKCRDNRLHEDKYRKEVMEREFRIRAEMLHRRIEGEELAARATSYGGGMERPVGDPQHPVPSDGEPVRHIEEQPRYHAGSACPGGGADQGSGNDPSAAGATGTGWEEERLAAFSAEATPAHTQSGMAVGHPDPGGIVRSVAALGHALERSQRLAPAASMTGYDDRKALSQERKKKISMGHKADDHEEQQTWQQKM